MHAGFLACVLLLVPAASAGAQENESSDGWVAIDDTVFIRPATLDLGPIPIQDVALARFTIQNRGDAPRRLYRPWRAVARVDGKEQWSIQPGESVDFKLSVKSGNVERDIRETATISVDGAEPFKLHIRARAHAFVRPDSRWISPTTHPSGMVTLRSSPLSSFAVREWCPPPYVRRTERVSPWEVRLWLDWDAIEAMNRLKLVIYTTHPSAPRVILDIRTWQPQRAAVVPLWRRLASITVVFACALLVMRHLLVRLHRWLAWRRGSACLCGYDLRGSPTGRCPECGRARRPPVTVRPRAAAPRAE